MDTQSTVWIGFWLVVRIKFVLDEGFGIILSGVCHDGCRVQSNERSIQHTHFIELFDLGLHDLLDKLMIQLSQEAVIGPVGRQWLGNIEAAVVSNKAVIVKVVRQIGNITNVFRVVDLLRDVPSFSGQDFTWLDGKMPKIFSQEAVNKAYRQRKKEMGEVFIPALCLVAQLGFGIRDFRQALIPLVGSLDDEEVSRNPAGFAKQFDDFFSEDKHRDDAWMSITNVSVEYLPCEKGLVRRMHYASGKDTQYKKTAL